MAVFVNSSARNKVFRTSTIFFSFDTLVIYWHEIERGVLYISHKLFPKFFMTNCAFLLSQVFSQAHIFLYFRIITLIPRI